MRSFRVTGKKLRRALRSRLKRSRSSGAIGITLPSAANMVSMSSTLSGVTSRRNAGTFSASSRPLRS